MPEDELQKLRELIHLTNYQRRAAKKAIRGKHGLIRDFFTKTTESLTQELLSHLKRYRELKKMKGS